MRTTSTRLSTALVILLSGFTSAAAEPVRLLETDGFFPGDGAGGYAINEEQYVGVRFFLSTPVITSSVGGQFGTHFPTVDMFAALVRLSGPMDVPDSTALDTPDVLGATLLRVAPDPSRMNDDFAAAITTELTDGWYALIFGAGGPFGSSVGPLEVAATNGLTVPFETWPFFLVRPTLDVFEEIPNRQLRFFLDGRVAPAPVPEPTTLSLLILSGAAAVVRRRRLRRHE